MESYEIQVAGAKVIESTEPPKPYNPLRRPPIGYRNMCIALGIYLGVMLSLTILGILFFPAFLLWALLGWTLLYAILIAKKTVIWLIHLYQNKASDRTRLKCVFEPSCSEYMLLAIEKYGLLRGVLKGIRRLLRCHPPNGGKDYP